MDSAPREVYATLLDEGKYLSSWRTMYRILNEVSEVRERRNQARHVEYSRPELLATKPRELWSWDITKRTPVKGSQHSGLTTSPCGNGSMLNASPATERETGTIVWR